MYLSTRLLSHLFQGSVYITLAPFLQGDQQTILLLIILRSKIYDDDDDLNSLRRTFLQKSFVVLTKQGFKLLHSLI